MDSQHSPLTSKAEDLFQLQIATLKLQAELCDMLDSFPSPFNWSDFSYDYYDCSIQLFGVPDTYKLCGEDAVKLREFGFWRVWLHTVENNSDYVDTKPRSAQGERYFHL